MQVVLPDKFGGKGNEKSQKSAIKLIEIGPRMTLELFKVESGLCEGDILYHKFETKSAAEALRIKQKVIHSLVFYLSELIFPVIRLRRILSSKRRGVHNKRQMLSENRKKKN